MTAAASLSARLASAVRSAEAHAEICISAREAWLAELSCSDAETAEQEAISIAAEIRVANPCTEQAREARDMADRAIQAAQLCRDKQHERAYRSGRRTRSSVAPEVQP